MRLPRLNLKRPTWVQLQFTAPDSAGFMKGATLTVGAIDSAGIRTAGSGAGAATSFYAGVTVPTPMSALKVGAAFDYLDLHNGGLAANPNDDSTWNIGLYQLLPGDG